MGSKTMLWVGVVIVIAILFLISSGLIPRSLLRKAYSL